MIRANTSGVHLCLALLFAVGADAAWAQPCEMAVAQGFLELHRARFPAALTQFDQALGGSEECVIEAHLGKASTYNASNDHKQARVEAEVVLRATDDPELLAEAHYQVGVALHKRGSRMNKKKAEAEAAFQRAVEVSGGEHRGAIRALWRLYQETRREDDLTALKERFPEVKVLTRGERLRAGKPPPKKAEEAEPKKPDCLTDVTTGWDQELPQFLGEDDPEARGFVAPRLTAGGQPGYTDEAREAGIQGSVEVEALLDVKGNVTQVRVLKRLHPDLDEAAIIAACGFAFEPARTPEGEPTAAYVLGVFEFRLPAPE
ncbi:MAG: energy transducer TonB [bacterium]|nr:energy transducer TonB [bacterium]